MSEIRTEAVASNKGRAIVGRILPGTDLVKGIDRICQDNQVTSATIVAGIGSLIRAQFIYAVPDNDAPIGIKYSEPTQVEGPLELLACQGTVGLTAEGGLGIHLHGLMSGPDMEVYGGHFLEGGNPVLATLEIRIHENQDVRIVREQDGETGFPLFRFYEV